MEEEVCQQQLELEEREWEHLQHMDEQCLIQEEELSQQYEMLEAHRHEQMQQEEE